MIASVYCASCGNEIANEGRYCSNCGRATADTGMTQKELEAVLAPMVHAVFRADVGTTHPCPICANSDWSIFKEPVSVNSLHADHGLLAIALICQKCGFIRSHAAGVLDQCMDPRGG
jgi:hypothetical protein